jgi:hypothetical protein
MLNEPLNAGPEGAAEPIRAIAIAANPELAEPRTVENGPALLANGLVVLVVAPPSPAPAPSAVVVGVGTLGFSTHVVQWYALTTLIWSKDMMSLTSLATNAAVALSCSMILTATSIPRQRPLYTRPKEPAPSNTPVAELPAQTGVQSTI